MAHESTTQPTCYPEEKKLYMALELSKAKWLVRCSSGGRKTHQDVVLPNDEKRMTALVRRAKEKLGWRTFSNRREVGASVGLVGTPYDSGEMNREQGISKAGNRRVRTRLIELSWLWLRYQPNSDLTKWFRKRYAGSGKRSKRIGIVAVARRLLIQLWHFVEHDVKPKDAIIVKP